MNILYTTVLTVVMTGLGFLVGFFYRKRLMEAHIESLEGLGKKILDEARKEAENIKKESRLQAKDQLYQLKQDFEKETQERRQETAAGTPFPAKRRKPGEKGQSAG